MGEEIIHIRISKRMKEKLEKMAMEDGLTVSELVRDALRVYSSARASMAEYLTPIEKLIKDSTSFFGFNPDRLYRLAEERGFKGDRWWTDKALAMVLKVALKEEEADDLFNEGIVEDTIKALTKLGVSRERIDKILTNLKKPLENEIENSEIEIEQEEDSEESP